MGHQLGSGSQIMEVATASANTQPNNTRPCPLVPKDCSTHGVPYGLNFYDPHRNTSDKPTRWGGSNLEWLALSLDEDTQRLELAALSKATRTWRVDPIKTSLRTLHVLRDNLGRWLALLRYNRCDVSHMSICVEQMLVKNSAQLCKQKSL